MAPITERRVACCAMLLMLATGCVAVGSALASFDLPPGWYSGDVHVHWPDACYGVASPADVLAAMPPDLNFAAVLIWCGGDTFAADAAAYFNGKQDDPVSTATQVVHYDLEVSLCDIADRMGHVNYLYLDDIFFPAATYQGPIMAWAHAQDGYVGFDHTQEFVDSYDEFPPLQSCCIPYEAPMAVALDRVDYLTYQPTGSLGWRFLWYTLLDCGFRPGLAASTDAFCIPFTIGSKRTWARIDGPMTYGNFVDAIAQGRMTTSEDCDSFLHFTVDGVEVGEEIQLTPGTAVNLQARVVLPDHTFRSGTVEIVINHQVVASQAYAQTGGEVLLTTNVALGRSSWLTARTEKSHAGAVFAIVDGNPIRATVESPQYYVDYMDWYIAAVQSGHFNQLTGEDEAALLADIAAAKAIFEQIRQEALQVVAVEEAPPIATVGVLPNPSRGVTSIALRGRDVGDAIAQIFSLDGRLVRDLPTASPRDDGGVFTWDGHDAEGHQVASGVYVYRVSSRGRLVGQGKIVRVQ